MAERASDAVGMRLLAVTAELHVFQDEFNWEQPLRLGISISGQGFVRIWQQRGERMGYDERLLEPEDFGEVGRVEVHDITDRLAPDLRGMEVREARIIQSATGAPNGLALLRPGGKAFCIWIDEDEFRWGDGATLFGADHTGPGKARLAGLLWEERPQKDP